MNKIDVYKISKTFDSLAKELESLLKSINNHHLKVEVRNLINKACELSSYVKCGSVDDEKAQEILESYIDEVTIILFPRNQQSIL